MIEAAAFIVCLDDERPSTPSERCNQFFLGDPANRWADKTLQFVICENGVSATVGEHTMLDGLSVSQLSRFIAEAILEHPTGKPTTGANNRQREIRSGLSTAQNQSTSLNPNDSLVKELSVTMNPEMESRVHHIREQFRAQFEPIEFTRFKIETFGKGFLHAHKCPSKTGYQMVIQLACYFYYGYNPPSWETISVARFHKGRVDWIQAVQPAVTEFCAAVADPQNSLTEQRKLFFKAAHVHVNTMTQIARGQGFKAHLHALHGVLRPDEMVPALFQDPTWERTRVQSTKTVKTDCLEGLKVQEMAFLMPKADCMFLHYEVEENG
jgi:Choline/Carnitine o-acyltransferase